MATTPMTARNEPDTNELPAALDTLRREVAADAAAFLAFRQHDDEIVVSAVQVAGELRNWWMLEDGPGPDGFDHDASDDALSMREGQWCLEAPARRHFNQFCWFDDDVAQRAPWERTAAYHGLYAPNEIADQFRAILVDHGEVVGWLALLWRESPRQVDLVERRAEAKLDVLKDIVRAEHTAQRRPHRLLLDRRDDLLAVSPGADDAFDPEMLRSLRLRARMKASSPDESVRYFKGYALETVPMTGEDGVKATFVLVEPMQPVTIDMRAALTSLQHRVAELVAEGKSNREAAEILDVSVNTVKYHLKNIYPIVGVTNRVELASFLSRE